MKQNQKACSDIPNQAGFMIFVNQTYMICMYMLLMTFFGGGYILLH